jgi:SAM-dependent methyltransferase
MNSKDESYYEGMNLKLLSAIPQDAGRVLELGCAKGQLGRRFKETHPETYWHGVDISVEAAVEATKYLDAIDVLDLDDQELKFDGQLFDTIVIGDVLEHLRNPDLVLEALYKLSEPHARIVCCVPNMSHFSVVQRLIAGDITYDQAGLLDLTHRRFFSPSSFFKLMLDCGWLPHMVDHYSTGLPQSAFTLGLIEAAKDMGLPPATAVRNLSLYQMIVVAQKWCRPSLGKASRKAAFSVIVPVNRPWQYELNILRSPGLSEVGAKVVCVQSAENAAAAFASGLAETTTPWVIMAHQDVYFPSGTGLAIASELAAIEDSGLAGTPVGFAGVSKDAAGVSRYSGWVIDRQHLFQHPGSVSAESIDELAIALHRDSKIVIDPQLGWHLWATDLCLQAERLAQKPIGRILEVPVFHNSVNDYNLPDEFHRSAQLLAKKYPGRNKFMTLCGQIA